MSFVDSQSFDPHFLGNKGKTKLARSKTVCHPDVYSYKKLNRDFANFFKKWLE